MVRARPIFSYLRMRNFIVMAHGNNAKAKSIKML